MSLRKQALSKAAETSKATMKIGFIGQVILQGGIVARFAKQDEKAKCFVPYSEDESEETTRKNAMALAAKVTGKDHTDFMPCLWVQVVPDTSLTPTSRYRGSFISLDARVNSNPRTHKRHGEFAFDHMSDEWDELSGKKAWAHIAWVRLTEDYGGDLTLTGDDANDDLGVIITHLGAKRAATDLAKALREGEISTDDLANARGYDVVGVRQAVREAANQPSAAVTAVLTDIGAKTKLVYMTLPGFLEAGTVEYLEKNFKTLGGDVEATAAKCGTDPGDLAIILNQPQYFKDLMEATGLGEQEGVAKVAADTGLAHAADLAKFLGITEAPF